MTELLKTKLFIPRPRSGLLARPRLVERINAGLDKKLTLIAAPAGFGKTTLLSEWIPHSPRCVTWLSLSAGDNDPTRFWAYFITSLQQLQPQLGQDALALLQSPRAPHISSILTAWINELVAFPDVFAAVLDDYHVINAEPVHTALAFLIDHLPANMHLVITSRSDPPLPVGRLRARDQLTELRANDLRFTPGEAAAFLHSATGLSLPSGEVAELEARTEGWIAGLQIAALSLEGRSDFSAFIRSFSGSHRHIIGYLAEEVINHLPAATLDFLLQTSILDRLCASLCDAVTGGSDGQALLESLVEANLFITPLDDAGEWYRYHYLFAEVLKIRLHRVQRDQVSTLHRRAGKWFASHGLFEEAVQHELSGANPSSAADLIEQIAGDLLRRGAAASLVHWLDALPDEMVRSRPRLCLARGWTCLWGQEFNIERAGAWAELALSAFASGMDRELEGEIYAQKALIAADLVRLSLSRELAQRALGLLPPNSPWRAATTFCLGSALYAAGELPQATAVLSEALRLSQADGALYTQLLSASFLADIQVFQGYLDRAAAMYRQVLDWGGSSVPQKGALLAHAGLANVLCEQNQLEAALAHALSGIEQLEQVGGPGAALWLYRTLARIQQARGRWAEAFHALDSALRSGESARVPFVTAQASALRARAWLAQGDLQSATRWASGCGLDPEAAELSRPGLREMEYLTYARVLAAQGRRVEALAMLERLLEPALAEERRGSVIEILVLQSSIHYARGLPAQALECLERALLLAEPQGFVRSFVGEGETVRRLLSEFRAIIRRRLSMDVNDGSLRLLNYTDRLLAAFDSETLLNDPLHSAGLSSLSERELDILRLISSGRTNQEIADVLTIAVSTVKSHINSLYGKLGAERRTQAIAIAREIGLLTE